MGTRLFSSINQKSRIRTFSWPRTSSEARLLSPKQFEWLMDGFNIYPVIKITHPKNGIAVCKTENILHYSEPYFNVPVNALNLLIRTYYQGLKYV